jgi:hypothetical protein
MSAFRVFGGSISEGQFFFAAPPREVNMPDRPRSCKRSLRTDPEAIALIAQARVLSGPKLEQLVVRLQRHTGCTKQECWRFVIQYGIKSNIEHRRWEDEEIELVREELVKLSVEEVARRHRRTPKAVRSMLERQGITLRGIRCDSFSLNSLAAALHVQKKDVRLWIEKGWLRATCKVHGARRIYQISPEALSVFYKQHVADLLRSGRSNLSLFEAYVQYCYSPKHTVGEQLLQVRSDKRERASYAALQNHAHTAAEEEDEDEEAPEPYRIGDAVSDELLEE